MKIRKINPFIIAYVLGLVVLAGVGYAVSNYTIEHEHLNQPEVFNKRFASDVRFIALPRMNLSLSSAAGSSGQVRIDMSLEVAKGDLPRFEDFQPVISDRLVSYVQKMNMEEMKNPNAFANLRREMLARINAISYPTPVLDIVFRQFVVM